MLPFPKVRYECMNDLNKLNEKLFDVMLEEATQKYAEDIAKENIDIPEKELETINSRKKEIYRKTLSKIKKQSGRRLSLKKCVLIVAVSAIVLTLSLNVSAIRILFFKTYTDISGTILNVKTTKIDDERYNEIVQFEGKSELIIPGWLPPGMELTDVSDNNSFVNFNYTNTKLWITLSEERISEQSETSIETDKNMFKIEDCLILGLKGKIINIKNEDNITNYIVIWNSNNIKYELATNVNKNTLDAILSSLKYLNN